VERSRAMDAPALLRSTLLANAAFSLVCGVLLVALASPLKAVFGLPAGWPLLLIGFGLLPFAVLVGITARQPTPKRSYVLGFAVADVAWVLASVLVLVLAWEMISPLGRSLIAGVALVVAGFAHLQFLGVGRADLREVEEPPLPLRAAIWNSWRSMKTWVKVWLFVLNAIFLLALAFPLQPLTRWVLLAYVASGPLLLGMMVWQRGLTRLLGLAHLVPWTPLVVYLVLRLTGDALGPQLRLDTHGNLYLWVLVLLAAVTVCLALDIYELLRWLRGERFVLGSPEAARRGASMRTLP